MHNHFRAGSQKYRIYNILINNLGQWVRASQISFETSPKILNYTARISEIRNTLPAGLTILNKTHLRKKHNIKLSWYCLYQERQKKSVYKQMNTIISQFNDLFL